MTIPTRAITIIASLLAVALQVAAAAHGGRVCLRSSPLPLAQSCSEQCCDRTTDDIDGCDRTDFTRTCLCELNGSWPTECCITHSLIFWSPSADQHTSAIDLHSAIDFADVLGLVQPGFDQGLESVGWGALRETGLPPPQQSTLRAVVLLI